MGKGGKAGKWMGLLIVKFFFFLTSFFSNMGVFYVEPINIFDE